MTRVNKLKEFLWILAFFGLVAMIARLVNGLGATTDLSDAVPWGLWKIVNMVRCVLLRTRKMKLPLTYSIRLSPKTRTFTCSILRQRGVHGAMTTIRRGAFTRTIGKI